MIDKLTAIIAVVVIVIASTALFNFNQPQPALQVQVPIAIQGIEGNSITIRNTGGISLSKPVFLYNNQPVTASGGDIAPGSSATYEVGLPVYALQNATISVQGSLPDNRAAPTILITTNEFQSGQQPAAPVQNNVQLPVGQLNVTTQPTSNKSTVPPTPLAPTPSVPLTGFVAANGTRLTLNNSAYRFVGVNIYGLASDDEYNCGGNPDDPEEYVENVFAVLEQNHINAVRFWAFQSFSHDNFTAIDRVINAAKRHNVKLIPTLENHWGDCTQGDKKTAAWYASPELTYGSYALSFKGYIERIVARYKNEPAILMWQLMNEAESEDAASLLFFASNMSALVKRIDSNHLVSFGTLGTDQAGTNDQHYINLHSLLNINVVEAHDYHHETEPLPGYPWNGDVDEIDTIAADLEVSKRLNKPFFIGEAGINRPDRIELFRTKMNAAFNNGTVGYLIWDFELEECGGYCFYPGDPLIEIFQEYN